MPSLPSSLALTPIGLGAPIVSTDHSNNYAAIQLDVNTLISVLSGGTAGQFLSGVGTALTWTLPPGSVLVEASITANVVGITGTAFPGTAIVTCGAFTFDGATAVELEFGAPNVSNNTAGARVFFDISDGGVSVGRIGTKTAIGVSVGDAIYVKRKFTPSAAAHTYAIVAYVSAGTGQVNAGAGGASVDTEAFLRIKKA